MFNLVVLISGSGTNLQALINACDSAQLDARVSLVISSSHTAFGLQRAASAGLNTKVLSLTQYYKNIPKDNTENRRAARADFDNDLANLILAQHSQSQVDLVVCAGWMLILGSNFLGAMAQSQIPVINLHPALPGTFAGINAIECAWQAFQKGQITKAGVMIHYVIAAVDAGEPLVVTEIPCIIDESLESFEERIHAVEHEAIVKGTAMALQKKTARDLNG